MYMHSLASLPVSLPVLLSTYDLCLLIHYLLPFFASLPLSLAGLSTHYCIYYYIILDLLDINQPASQQQIVRRSFIHSYTLHGMCNDDEFALYEGAPSLGGEKTTIIRQRILSRLIYFIIIWETQSVRQSVPGPQHQLQNTSRIGGVKCDAMSERWRSSSSMCPHPAHSSSVRVEKRKLPTDDVSPPSHPEIATEVLLVLLLRPPHPPLNQSPDNTLTGEFRQ